MHDEQETRISQWTQWERTESRLWRLCLLFVALLGVGLAASTWDRLGDLSSPLVTGLAAGVAVLTALFAAHAWQKRAEIAEMRGFVRAMLERHESAPSEQQLTQLFEIVANSQRGYRDLIDSFDDAVFSLSLDGRVQKANRRMAELLDEPVQRLIDQAVEDLLTEPVRTDVEKWRDRFLERRQWNGTVRARLRKTGQVRYFETVLRAIVKDGAVVGISGWARDVTQQRESEARFTELFETLQEGIYLCSPAGRLLDVNPAMVRMLGYESKEELLAAPDLALPAPGTADQPGSVREVALRTRSGAELVCLANSMTVFDAAGRVVRYQGTLVDVTHKKQIERRLHEEQEFVRRMVECFPDTVLAVDRAGRYTFVGPRVRDVVGANADDLIGSPFGKLLHPDDVDRVRSAFEDLITGRLRFATEEFRVRHENGTIRVVRANGAPLYAAEGGIAGAVVSLRDLTEFKHLERQVIQSEKLAATGKMIAGVAHELNNPLTVILGASETNVATANAEFLQRRFDLIRQQARRTADIVQNLLTFARPATAGNQPLALNDLVRRALQLTEYSLRVESITVDFLPADRLRPAAGDPNQIVQVFINILTNAQQAIREARDRGSIRIRSGESASGVWVTFQDDGPGIPSHVLPNIFDPFFTTKRPGRGTGLGLSISLSIIKEHDGRIEAQNAPGGGAVFTVTLPVAAPRAAPPVPETPVAIPDLDGIRILVVDDEPSIVELVRMSLVGFGASVDTCLGGLDAITQALREKYDVILCDMKMPDVSGRQVFEQIVQHAGFPAARFILMTGDLLDSPTLDFRARTKCALLQKPFSMSDLSARLNDVLAVG